MKRFRKLIFICLIILVLLISGVNLIILYVIPESIDGQYKVEIHRLMNEIQENRTFEKPDLTGYKTIGKIEFLSVGASEDEIEEFYRENSIETEIRPLFQEENLTGYVRFNYHSQSADAKHMALIIANIAFVVICIVLAGVFIYLRIHLLKPFDTIAEMPKRLARGQFSKPVKIAKGQYFEEFLWALDVLRDSMETQKKQMEKIDRDRKTLVLSLSHDIKTPLSTISLYVKALKENLYDKPEKQQDILNRVEERIQEIEMYMQEMVRGSSEDMLSIDVQISEFYLNDLLKQLQHNYKEKLKLLQTELVIDNFPDVILKGDIDRTLEALENVIENALKYGDGKKIKIGFAREENSQLISVSNYGVELPREESVHIFDAFWRGSNTKGKPGSGLGLYIARQILQKMGGEIFANVEGDTMQVTFVLDLA